VDVIPKRKIFSASNVHWREDRMTVAVKVDAGQNEENCHAFKPNTSCKYEAQCILYAFKENVASTVVVMPLLLTSLSS
jgi:hypothetical protein